MFTKQTNLLSIFTKTLIFVISFIFLYVSIGFINSFELKAQDASPQLINQENAFSDEGSWSSATKPATANRIKGGYIDTTNNKLWLFDIREGAYYRSINSQGTPEGDWSSAGEPPVSNIIKGGYIDTTNNKLWLFDYHSGAYYRLLNSQGVPYGSWSSATKPEVVNNNIEGGYIDTINNKLWLFDFEEGAYYRSINSQGTPEGDWSSATRPETANGIDGGYIDTQNNKLWLFDVYSGAYYRSINSQGTPEGDWSSAGEPPTASRIEGGGYIDTTNNKLWLLDVYDGAYYRSINSQGTPEGDWSSAGEPPTASRIEGGYIDTINNKLWLFDYSNGAYYRSIDTSNTGSNDGNLSGAPASAFDRSIIVTDGNNELFPTYALDSYIFDGDLIKVANSPDIYIVKLINGKRFRRLILNPEIFNSYGHLSWDDVKTIDSIEMSFYTISDLVREIYPNGSIVPPGNVYKIYPQGDVGTKRLIRLTQAEFESNFDKDSIYNINHLEASETFYRMGADIINTYFFDDFVVGDIFYGQDPSPDSSDSIPSPPPPTFD